MIKILIPLLSLAIGYYFQWQANRMKKNQWKANNSYQLGRMYKQISRYETIAKFIYLTSLIITCATFLF